MVSVSDKVTITRGEFDALVRRESELSSANAALAEVTADRTRVAQGVLLSKADDVRAVQYSPGGIVTISGIGWGYAVDTDTIPGLADADPYDPDAATAHVARLLGLTVAPPVEPKVGDTAAFWEAVDELAEFVNERAASYGDKAHYAIETLRETQWCVSVRNQKDA